ncbi:ATP-dependent Zn protease [Methylobacterium sp. OAE515]|uniref:hypothetical protein n=1 Tax=Methylobacterium sp. OAE515 TaxID=2817895 RepID=UPI0019DCC812
MAGLEAALASTLAGRIAEEIELGAGSAGAGLGPASDLAIATHIARNIELSYGFGHLGNIHLEAASGEMIMIAGLLPAVAERLRRAGERARAILTERRPALQAIAHLLERKGYLSRVEIERVLATNAEQNPCGSVSDVEEVQ